MYGLKPIPFKTKARFGESKKRDAKIYANCANCVKRAIVPAVTDSNFASLCCLSCGPSVRRFREMSECRGSLPQKHELC